MNNTIKLGLVLTGVSVIATIIIRLIDITLLFATSQILFSIVLTSIIIVVLGRRWLRNPEKGRLGYGEAVKSIFIASMISALVSTLVFAAMFGNDDEVLLFSTL